MTVELNPAGEKPRTQFRDDLIVPVGDINKGWLGISLGDIRKTIEGDIVPADPNVNAYIAIVQDESVPDAIAFAGGSSTTGSVIQIPDFSVNSYIWVARLVSLGAIVEFSDFIGNQVSLLADQSSVETIGDLNYDLYKSTVKFYPVNALTSWVIK